MHLEHLELIDSNPKSVLISKSNEIITKLKEINNKALDCDSILNVN